MRGRQAGAPVTGVGVNVGQATTPYAAFWETGARQNATTNMFSAGLRVAADSGGFPSIRVLVNDIRTANMLQLMMERNARGGTRYTEIIRSHFGVVSPDARLQRPEFLGGGRSPVTVSPVAQTSATGVAGTTTVLGEQAGVASVVLHNHGFSRSFTEHGTILGLISVRSDLTYQQGLERFWSRRTQYDFYWPGLAHLGEQAVYQRELFSDGSAGDSTVFGYQERWSEYKYKPSRTSGYFRSIVGTPLDMWHLGQKFASAPTLNSLFIVDQPPMSRVLQVSTNFGEEFLADFFFDARWVRPMPMFSIPGLGDRM